MPKDKNARAYHARKKKKKTETQKGYRQQRDGKALLCLAEAHGKMLARAFGSSNSEGDVLEKAQKTEPTSSTAKNRRDHLNLAASIESAQT